MAFTHVFFSIEDVVIQVVRLNDVRDALAFVSVCHHVFRATARSLNSCHDLDRRAALFVNCMKRKHSGCTSSARSPSVGLYLCHPGSFRKTAQHPPCERLLTRRIGSDAYSPSLAPRLWMSRDLLFRTASCSIL
jgi:hypothetical protein